MSRLVFVHLHWFHSPARVCQHVWQSRAPSPGTWHHQDKRLTAIHKQAAPLSFPAPSHARNTTIKKPNVKPQDEWENVSGVKKGKAVKIGELTGSRDRTWGAMQAGEWGYLMQWWLGRGRCRGGGRGRRGEALTDVTVYLLFNVLQDHAYPEYLPLHLPLWHSHPQDTSLSYMDNYYKYLFRSQHTYNTVLLIADCNKGLWRPVRDI